MECVSSPRRKPASSVSHSAASDNWLGINHLRQLRWDGQRNLARRVAAGVLYNHGESSHVFDNEILRSKNPEGGLTAVSDSFTERAGSISLSAAIASGWNLAH